MMTRLPLVGVSINFTVTSSAIPLCGFTMGTEPETQLRSAVFRLDWTDGGLANCTRWDHLHPLMGASGRAVRGKTINARRSRRVVRRSFEDIESRPLCSGRTRQKMVYLIDCEDGQRHCRARSSTRRLNCHSDENCELVANSPLSHLLSPVCHSQAAARHIDPIRETASHGLTRSRVSYC
jgi:hypothetical protein